MIKANELRIGNWVSNGDHIQIDFYNLNTNLDGKYIDFDPIPLTPEILGKCGFKHGMVEGVTRLRDADDNSQDEGDTHYWDLRVPTNDKVEGLNTFSLVKFGEDGITFSNQWLRVKLSSLHQLQNLYFTLTGEELNYTP